jgi:hypothetical protein
MRIDMNASPEQKFTMASWWSTSADYVVYTLNSQLKAAAVIWPELTNYAFGKIAPTDGETAETAGSDEKQ